MSFHIKIHLHICLHNCFGLFSLINSMWSLHTSLLIQKNKYIYFPWRKRYYGLHTCVLARSNVLKLKKTLWWNCQLQTCSFSLHNWCYCDVFISCLDSHSDGTHSLHRIHWWRVSDVMLHFSKSVPMKKQTHLNLGWPQGEYIFSRFSFNKQLLFEVL